MTSPEVSFVSVKITGLIVTLRVKYPASLIKSRERIAGRNDFFINNTLKKEVVTPLFYANAYLLQTNRLFFDRINLLLFFFKFFRF